MAGQDTYDFGQCTWYVASTLAWVQGRWGNAYQWAVNAAHSGLSLTTIPTLGSVVVYGAGGGYSEFGHVAIVIAVYSPTQFLVSEMNFVAWDQIDQRVSNMGDVVAFILPPGVGAGAGLGGPTGSGAGSPDAVLVEWRGLADWLNQGADGYIARLRRARAILDQIA